MNKYVIIILLMLGGTAIGQSLTAKKEGKKWGFVNERDSFVVAPQYDAVGDFVGAYTWVTIGGKVKKDNLPQGGKWGLIDEKGQLVCPIEYDFVAMPYENKVAVNLGGEMSDNEMAGGRWGLYDIQKQQLIVPVEFDYVGTFNNDLVWVVKNHKYGVLNVFGKFVYECNYDEATDCYDNERLWLKKDGKWGLADKSGKMITEFLFEDCSGFMHNIAWVKDKELYGLINENGQIILQPHYNKVEPFYNGVANVWSLDGKSRGLVNEQGVEIAKPVYATVAKKFGVTQFKTRDKIFSYMTHVNVLVGTFWIDQTGKVLAKGVKPSFKITDIIPDALWDF